MKISTPMKTKWMQFKVSALSASVAALIVSSIPTQISASDIDIYQAGGTGAINIYYMLDVSGSMGKVRVVNDYKHTANISHISCKLEREEGRNYIKRTWGGDSVRWATFDYVGPGKGQYNESGDNYEFVGSGNGSYQQTRQEIYFFFGATRYSRSDEFEVMANKCENTKNICHDYQILDKNLIENNYIYAYKGEAYCQIDESWLDESNAKDKNYLNKIKQICEPVSTGAKGYNCLTRLANLKKGFFQLINNENTLDSHNFALGQYTGLSDNGGVKTLLDFTAMNADGKKKISKLVEGLKADGGTPIALAYNEASTKILAGNALSNAKPSCSGNGIYFLTDGQPDPATTDLFGSDKVSDSDLAYGSKGGIDYWQRVAGKAKYLYNHAKLIKTATVGFGGEYYLSSDYAKNGNFNCNVYDHPEKGLCLWGTKNRQYGQGGFYNAQSAEDIVSSINQFVSDVSVPIEGATMGTNTIPVDALDSTRLQNYSYFPMFKPIAGGKEQLWAGNLKKFEVKTSTGTVVDQSDKPVFKDGKIQEKLSDYWFEANGSSDDDVYMAWGGLLSKLKVHHKPLITSGNLGFNRNVYLDIGVNNGNDLKHAVIDVLKGSETLENKKHYLYGLLGYSKLTQSDFDALASKSYNEQLSYLQTKTSTQDFQMGSVIHSTPIMLTQKGVFEEKDGEYGVTTREDYILAGTTQGLVQVVNADNGKEVFSFLPSEFLTRTNNPQEKGFAESLALDRFKTANTDKFFYGIDGPWVAHTEYEYIFEGDKEIMTAKKQYAYGGLRMGGRSYYALDLTNLGKTSGKPKLLFAIKPDNHTSGALSYMGESWSKPVITYIPWKGQKKLAMIVGGGYDRLYEKQLTNTELSGNVAGNGIYIFAAEDLDTNTKAGSLLWWGSSNATNSTSSTKIDAMTHSIPSRVKAVDRNGDGITDHLYVGDLGGQVFRVDFNSKLGTSATNTTLVHQAEKIADLNTSGKTPRRFYEAPTFTIHKDGNGKRFAMVTLASGDRSSPLGTGTSYPQDYVVAIKDDTVTSNPVGTPTLITLDSMHDISGTGSFNKGTHKGWFYPMPKIGIDAKHQVRAMEEGIALDNDLYYSLFNPDESTAKDGDATECTGGIVGSSSAYKFCLPYGDKTCFGTTTSTNPEKIGDLGAGIIGLTFGAGRSTATNRTLIFNKDIDPKPPEYTVSDKLVPKRWFEYLPFNSGDD